MEKFETFRCACGCSFIDIMILDPYEQSLYLSVIGRHSIGILDRIKASVKLLFGKPEEFYEFILRRQDAKHLAEFLMFHLKEEKDGKVREEENG